MWNLLKWEVLWVGDSARKKGAQGRVGSIRLGDGTGLVGAGPSLPESALGL